MAEVSLAFGAPLAQPCLGAEGVSVAHKHGSRAWQHTVLVLLKLVENQAAEELWFLAVTLKFLEHLFSGHLSTPL